MRLRVLIACAVALAPLVLWAALPLRSQGASPAELQQKIDSARSQIQAKRGKERVLTTDVERWSSKINRLQGKIGSLQSRQASLESDLQAKQAELSRTQADLRSERARLARLRSRLVVARKALSTRLVEMYKADRPDALSVVLNSDGFADLLERGEFIKRISEQDRQVVTLVRDAKKDATATAKRLDALERRQQEITTAVLDRRNEVAAVKQDLIDTRVGFQQTREVKANALSKIRVSRQELESHVAGLEKEQARIQATLTGPAPAGAGPIKQGSGQLIWPANGAVSSSFGQRWGRLHAGIDIPLSVGTPLRAADGGRVAIAGWTGGYGNYTCIQHNGSLSTCYAHQSSIGVSVGQNVSQGQVIGMSGNTGNSTGPHLHFEVRINGSPVDPMGYL